MLLVRILGARNGDILNKKRIDRDTHLKFGRESK